VGSTEIKVGHCKQLYFLGNHISLTGLLRKFPVLAGDCSHSENCLLSISVQATEDMPGSLVSLVEFGK